MEWITWILEDLTIYNIPELNFIDSFLSVNFKSRSESSSLLSRVK